MCSTVAGPSKEQNHFSLIWLLSHICLLRVHHPESPESFLAELSASLMANRTLMDTNIAGSPVARKIIVLWKCLILIKVFTF